MEARTAFRDQSEWKHCIPQPVGQLAGRGMQARASFSGHSVSRPGAECRRVPQTVYCRSADRARNASESRIPRPVSQSADRARNAGGNCIPWPVRHELAHKRAWRACGPLKPQAHSQARLCRARARPRGHELALVLVLVAHCSDQLARN